MPVTIRAATPAEVPAVRALLPRLAAFELPATRDPRHLWEGDAEILAAWGRHEAPDVFVQVAEDEHAQVIGATITTLRPEPLSHAPSAHLEVLVVAESAVGQGVGRALIDAMEVECRARGVGSITLHVFASNAKARALYERSGYEGELLRYIKWL
ncbi:MAG: GNAT family N-acetyltransferase [Gemmatimonadaceae bacterium]|jgi:ribosomal protein S18 acetylase RimI-like enzyme|nr:GNAT family N-acetyltransferase [Gemmatimonadaceae bacterium]